MDKDIVEEKNYTIIGRKTFMKGSFNFDGHVHIASHIEGDIQVNPGSSIKVDKEAFIDGHITCQDLEICGVVSGSIKSSGKVIIQSGASVSGEVEADHLIIYPGSIVNISGKTL